MTPEQWIKSGPLLKPIWQELSMSEEKQDNGRSTPAQADLSPGSSITRGNVTVTNIGTDTAHLEISLRGE